MGLMEVNLVEAKGLKGTDCLFGKIDPYVVIKYKGQERRSSVARGQGSNPKWNEKFTFRAEHIPGSAGNYNNVITFRLMDKDSLSSDDFLGHASIYVKDILKLGAENGTYVMHPTKYRVINFDDTYCGELKVGLTFTTKLGGEDEDERQINGGNAIIN